MKLSDVAGIAKPRWMTWEPKVGDFILCNVGSFDIDDLEWCLIIDTVRTAPKILVLSPSQGMVSCYAKVALDYMEMPDTLPPEPPTSVFDSSIHMYKHVFRTMDNGCLGRCSGE